MLGFAEDAPKERIAACRGILEERGRILCFIGLRFEADALAQKDALALFDVAGHVSGIEPEQWMDGGFRGRIHLVPELPVGKGSKHLRWVLAASRDFEDFFVALRAASSKPLRYRWRAISYRFFRSVGRTTPSAYASRWSVAYNLSGSLHRSADAVRETLFHEIFHLNDAAHGDWSKRTLSAIFDDIVARCGTTVACLRPYAPGDTKVRGGTYYAFQPDNGESVHEYAAELAGRYFEEERAVLRGERIARPPFKCGPEENKRAWALLVDEFFGGVDQIPPCQAP